MVRLSSSALTAVGAVLFSFLTTTTAVSTSVSSGFAANDGSVSFALNIPQDDDSNDLYFSMQGDASQSWIAIGMGNDKMDDSLIWMVYKDSTGKNLTLSPRLSYGHVEPAYSSNLSVQVLPGTEITSDGNYTLFAMCTNCRSWKGGSIDPTNKQANFIFASGPSGDLDSNSKSAGIKRHASYGVFQMDLTLAVGSAGAPIIATADTSGTKQVSENTDHDFSAALHACLMILAFVGLMPLGLLILRILNSVKWHGYNQGLSAAVALIGTAAGIYAGSMYQRSMHWNSAHQIFGLVIIAAMIGQFVLGFMHHRIYKRTQATTKLAPIHVWLGRIVIPAGIANGFLGFPLALNSKYDWALLVLVLLVVIVMGPFAFWRYKRNANKAATAAAVGYEGGYNAQPWTTDSNAASDVNLGAYPGGYGQQNHPPLYQNQGRFQPTAGRQFV
ncbi:CBD9-like protein [Mollisia scopiformis]|uniref:CBD9-like protein n=1 Tax=Mollisia scopiformis TaxID=149040 RepID=A0A194WW20_MOLSC|nr:CBD9-like protein [Mollisia scopiformis]KUJ11869.1 CBD9-like protein [Mollisia scopiformis]